jgi:lysophospholipase L1-like esterase
MINDDETIASLLQADDLERQYVNLGVSGSDAHEIICRLEAETAERYDGQIDELIYVYCENDLRYNRPFGRPSEVIGWLQEFAARQNIGKVTIVFAPYIYLAAPEVTRFRGYRGGETPHRVDRRQDLIEAVEQTDFEWVDFGEIAREAVESSHSQFGFFPLYVDHVHLSPEGARRLVERLQSRG